MHLALVERTFALDSPARRRLVFLVADHGGERACVHLLDVALLELGQVRPERLGEGGVARLAGGEAQEEAVELVRIAPRDDVEEVPCAGIECRGVARRPAGEALRAQERPQVQHQAREHDAPGRFADVRLAVFEPQRRKIFGEALLEPQGRVADVEAQQPVRQLVQEELVPVMAGRAGRDHEQRLAVDGFAAKGPVAAGGGERIVVALAREDDEPQVPRRLPARGKVPAGDVDVGAIGALELADHRSRLERIQIGEDDEVPRVVFAPARTAAAGTAEWPMGTTGRCDQKREGERTHAAMVYPKLVIHCAAQRCRIDP